MNGGVLCTLVQGLKFDFFQWINNSSNQLFKKVGAISLPTLPNVLFLLVVLGLPRSLIATSSVYLFKCLYVVTDCY